LVNNFDPHSKNLISKEVSSRKTLSTTAEVEKEEEINNDEDEQEDEESHENDDEEESKKDAEEDQNENDEKIYLKDTTFDNKAQHKFEKIGQLRKKGRK